MTDSILTCEQQDGVARMMLNRPEKRNALSFELLQALQRELTRLEQDATARVIVLGGNGPAFCAGHDLGEMTGRDEAEYQELFRTCSDVMLQLRRMPQPVIARVHGIATAAGCQLVAACDLAVASEEARFATPGVKIGLFCTTPMVPLVRAVPQKVAMEMLLTGQPITARRAWEIGLINRVASLVELDSVIAEYCVAIVNSSPLTIRLGKAAFQRQLTMSEPEAYGDAVCVMTENALKHDAQEGISAFLAKRAPKWTGT
ncbi:MAG: enoyl-CoA hydratase [Planctomycetaceae bacterium]|nr:enoyl-CoA hydratase [Planctomycetaceae bacterium]